MNEVWDAWVEPGAPPARAAAGVPALASDDFNLEISVIAAQSTSGAS
jgi:enamine deaminase RidA (YjgF/YER057c/UK114 family)